jgi:hypothetical protein
MMLCRAKAILEVYLLMDGTDEVEALISVSAARGWICGTSG